MRVVSAPGPPKQWWFLSCKSVFCETAVSAVMQQRDGPVTQHYAAQALSDRVLDFLNGFSGSCQSTYAKMLKKIELNPLSLLDYYPNV